MQALIDFYIASPSLYRDFLFLTVLYSVGFLAYGVLFILGVRYLLLFIDLHLKHLLYIVKNRISGSNKKG